MKKKTIIWLIGSLALLFQCFSLILLFGIENDEVPVFINFFVAFLPLVFVPTLCPLIYLYGVDAWNKRKVYPPWLLISWGVIIAFQVGVVTVNAFILVWGASWFISCVFPCTEISALLNFIPVLGNMFLRALSFWLVGKLFLSFLSGGPRNGAGMSASA